MTEIKESYEKKVESIHVKDLIKISINAEFLNENFELIKQCLKKIDSLQRDMNQNKNKTDKGNKQINERLIYIEKELEEQKNQIGKNNQQIKDMNNIMGEDFMRKFGQLEEKTKNAHNLDQIVKKIQQLNKFILSQNFKEFETKMIQEIKNVNKIKDDFGNFVDNNSFNRLQTDTNNLFINTNKNIEDLKTSQSTIEIKIENIGQKVNKAYDEVAQNNSMIKQINFAEIQQRLRKQKQQTQSKIGQLTTKLKKKVGSPQLITLQKVMIEKIDNFFTKYIKMADQQETKEALIYLQKRINELQEIFAEKNEQQQDALFSTKKWMCASCSKDLGKYQGKLGQFKPWAVFPCKQLNPQQSGGFGYLNYIQKITQKRGSSIDDSGIQRLSKTFYQATKELSPSKGLNTTSTNLISNYGRSSDKGIPSLREEYFKTPDKQKEGSKLFRVKRDQNKQALEKQKVKQF